MQPDGDDPVYGLGFSVHVDLRFRQLITLNTGSHVLAVYLKEEVPGTGWRISVVGTGP